MKSNSTQLAPPPASHAAAASALPGDRTASYESAVAAELSPQARRTFSVVSGGGEPIIILLVDDDADCRLLIRDAISQCKVSNSIYEVSDGHEALEFLARRGRHSESPRPGLIYLDVEMPGLDGLETLRRIKADPTLCDIPVVMMTGVCDEAVFRQAAEAGANSYTVKPANAEQFLHTVLQSTDYWLQIHQQPRWHRPPSEARR
jgi:two-component system response regulator